jgi:MutS domain V
MKAFLMYRDRDFDPQRLLIQREREGRNGRGTDPKLNLQQILPWNEQALRQDLGLDVVCHAMARGDSFLFEVAQAALLASLSDPIAVGYRQHVVADALRNAQVIRAIYRITVDAIEAERKNYWSFFARYPSGILHRAVDVLQMFVGALKRLRAIAEDHANSFASEGCVRLFAMLKQELTADYFAKIEAHLQYLKFRDGVLISARLGRGNKGTSYSLRRPDDGRHNWMARWLPDKGPAYTFRLHPRDEAGARALAELNDRGVNLVANALAQSTDHILGFFQMLRTELAFYLGCINLHDRLSALGEPLCLPRPAAAGTGALSCSGLYDAALALSKQEKVVGNDLSADGHDLVVVTGANNGGKSTFLRSVGLAQLMMQAGMFAPAKRFSAAVCVGMYTHYRREEDCAMQSGKWDEELGRMSNIVDRIRPNSLLLCNESFASTNEREGSEIAAQIVAALVDRGVRVLYVTHLYHFAQSVFVRQPDRTVFLLAERNPDGTRPFKLVEGEPLQTSYSEDLYRMVFCDER